MALRSVLRFPLSVVRPHRSDVLHRLGLGADDEVNERLEGLLGQAAALFDRRAAPAGILQEVSIREFSEVYRGDGHNAKSSPLAEVYPRADALALFAATLGRALDEESRALFERGDPALGYVLDVTASSAADRLALLTAEWYLDALGSAGRRTAGLTALSYSPGYCGWHVSGQHALFGRLRPDAIDLTLTASALMDPIKSVSGVIVAGPARVHKFRPTYAFCDACGTHDCRVRMSTVLAPPGS
jgi:hypothetical protein